MLAIKLKRERKKIEMKDEKIGRERKKPRLVWLNRIGEHGELCMVCVVANMPING